MAKSVYVGVKTECPIYEETTTTKEKTISITASNVSTYFTVTNNTYYFEGSGSSFTSNNVGIDNSTAETTFAAKQNIKSITFDYSYSTENQYDKFTLKVAGTIIKNAVSGVGSNSYNGSLTSGQTIIATYIKDESGSENDDKCVIENIVIVVDVTETTQTQIGTEIKEVARKVKKLYASVNGVARKIKKGYVGVNGVARQFFAAEPVWRLKTGSFIPTFATNATSQDGFNITYDTPYSADSTLGNNLYKFFDNNTSTYCPLRYKTDYYKGNDYHITMEFPKNIKPTKLTYTVDCQGTGSFRIFAVELSADNVNFDRVHSYDCYEIGAHTETITINPEIYKYMRFVIIPNNDTAAKTHKLIHCQITEWYEEEYYE